MENFIKEVLSASNRGVSAAKNVSGEPNWSFGQSLFFACTVITTIGKCNRISITQRKMNFFFRQNIY